MARDWQPNLSWVTAELAVGGGFPPRHSEALARTHGIRAVIDLRAEACDEAARLGKHGIAFLHLPTPDHHPVSVAMLDRAVAFAGTHLDRGEPLLIHCQHGIGRAPLTALCVLTARGHAPLEALELLKTRRPLTSPSPAQYEGWAAWLHGFRPRDAAWQVPDFDAFARIAYRHLAEG